MTGIDPRLRTRIERLERFGLWMLFALAAVPMVIGGFLPWYTDTSGKDQTFRLFTQGFELFAGQPEDSADLAFGVVFAGCFLFLDLMTLAALVILMLMAGGGWRRPKVNNAVAVLLLLCLLGAAAITVLTSGGENTEVHPFSLLVYGVGVIIAMGVLVSLWVREWWLPDDRG